MMLLFKFLFSILISIIVVDVLMVSAIEMQCSFSTANWEDGSNSYYCSVQNNGIYGSSSVKIDSVTGTHSQGRTNNDVKVLHMQLISFIPENVENIFKNLIGLHICESNFTQIHQNDLKRFPKLQHLSLHGLKTITVIEKDLFKFNPELTTIILNSNQITEIDPNVFDDLNKLRILDLSNNKCNTSFTKASTRSEVEKIIKRIQNSECSTKKAELKNDNAQVISNITLLQTENEKCLNENKNLTLHIDELKKNCTIEQTNNSEKMIAGLSNKVDMILNKLTEFHADNEKLREKLIESDNLIEKLSLKIQNIPGMNSQESQSENAESEKKDTYGGQLIITFGSNKPPVILVN